MSVAAERTWLLIVFQAIKLAEDTTESKKHGAGKGQPRSRR